MYHAWGIKSIAYSLGTPNEGENPDNTLGGYSSSDLGYATA